VSDQVSYSYKTSGKIIFCSLYFRIANCMAKILN
jgi:hypothetical protein